jgi:hypothetical protein
MAPVLIYKAVHIVGIMMVFLSFGLMIARTTLSPEDKSFKKLGGMLSGIGLFAMLLGGFGMLAKMKLGFPVWIIIKTVLWVILGGSIAIANRKAELGKPLVFGIILLGAIATYVALAKPFIA